MKKFKVTYVKTSYDTYELEVEVETEDEIDEIISAGKYGEEIEGEVFVESFSDYIEITQIEELESNEDDSDCEVLDVDFKELAKEVRKHLQGKFDYCVYVGNYSEGKVDVEVNIHEVKKDTEGCIRDIEREVANQFPKLTPISKGSDDEMVFVVFG